MQAVEQSETSLGTRLGALCDPLFGFAAARATREAALDAVQEAMAAALKAGRSGRHWRDDEELWAWLVGVARHKLADEYRKARTGSFASLGLDAAQLEGLLASGEMPGELSGREEAARLCRAALSELEPRQRRALEGFYREGKPQAEIARDLGASEKAVESLLARARQSLHAVLRRMLDKPEELL